MLPISGFILYSYANVLKFTVALILASELYVAPADWQALMRDTWPRTCIDLLPPILSMTRGLVDSTGGGTAEHQNQDYAPSHVLAGLLEFLDQLRDSQRDGEVIKGFSGPGDECYEEEEPIAGGVAIATAELDFGAFAIGGFMVVAYVVKDRPTHCC